MIVFLTSTTNNVNLYNSKPTMEMKLINSALVVI